MSNTNASGIKKELDGFRLSTGKISEKINGVSDFWKDNNYASLQTQIGELAKKSKAVIESGERACASIDKFFVVAAEDV